MTRRTSEAKGMERWRTAGSQEGLDGSKTKPLRAQPRRWMGEERPLLWFLDGFWGGFLLLYFYMSAVKRRYFFSTGSNLSDSLLALCSYNQQCNSLRRAFVHSKLLINTHVLVGEATHYIGRLVSRRTPLFISCLPHVSPMSYLSILLLLYTFFVSVISFLTPFLFCCGSPVSVLNLKLLMWVCRQYSRQLEYVCST